MALGKQGGRKKEARKKFVRAQRQAVVATEYASGKTQAEIGAMVGADQKTISRDLNEMFSAMQTSTALAVQALREKQLVRLEAMRDELWGAWMRSKEPIKTTRQQQINGEVRSGTARKMVSIDTTEQGGDPRIMNALVSVEEMIAKLAGTLAPTKQAATDPNGLPAPPPRTATPQVLVITIGANRRGDGP